MSINSSKVIIGAALIAALAITMGSNAASKTVRNGITDRQAAIEAVIAP